MEKLVLRCVGQRITTKRQCSNACAEDQFKSESPITSSTERYTSGPTSVYKVITVGAAGVGKSSLIVQFMYNEVQSVDYVKT